MGVWTAAASGGAWLAWERERWPPSRPAPHRGAVPPRRINPTIPHPPLVPEPISPAELDALLRPDPRSQVADLLMLRDSLDRMAGALQRLADVAGDIQEMSGRHPEPDEGHIPPRAD